MSVFQSKGQNKLGFTTMVNSLIENSIDTIGSEDLKELIDNQKVVILDARETEEYSVSHIQGAICVGYDNFKLENLPELNKDDTIAVYCSIGKRSEDVAKKLKDAGYENVLNHYGGIFDWTNRGLPVENNEGQKVKSVHPYNSFWGYWINNYEKKYEP